MCRIGPQVEELQALHETETRRRTELERALRDAAAMFKAELYDKQVCVWWVPVLGRSTAVAPDEWKPSRVLVPSSDAWSRSDAG